MAIKRIHTKFPFKEGDLVSYFAVSEENEQYTEYAYVRYEQNFGAFILMRVLFNGKKWELIKDSNNDVLFDYVFEVGIENLFKID